MWTPRQVVRVTVATAIALLWLTTSITGQQDKAPQDPLAKAKTLYAQAAYEDALAALAQMSIKATPAESREASAYQAFCYVALGRADEAKRAIESIVRVDPLYHPSENQFSPRVRAFFEDARKPLLPEIVKDSYARAKDAYEKKDMSLASGEFDRVIMLVDEIGPSPAVADIRTLAAGFRDLAKAALAPPPPPPTPVAAPTPVETPVVEAPPAPKPGTVDALKMYSMDDADVVKPVALSRSMPQWSPANSVEAKMVFRGTLELTIDETGKVTAASMLKGVRPNYDPMLLKATADWRFRPATKGGVPVKFLYLMEVQVGR